MEEIQDLVKQEGDRKDIEAVLGFYAIGVSIENIAKALKISIEKITQIIENQSNI